MENSAKELHYFGLDCGMLEFSKYILTIRNLKIIVNSSAFLETGLAEKIAVCALTTRLLKK
jgi:hypothetical protein